MCSRSLAQSRLIDRSNQFELRNFIDSLVAGKMDTYKIPGVAIGVVRDNSILYARGYGVINIQSTIEVNENSVFHTGSISKLFTASAITHLSRSKLLNYDDRIIKFVPELKYYDKRVAQITVRQLLNHTSGLKDIVNYHWRRNNQDEKSLKKYILTSKLKLKNSPGESYNYSNLGYDLLGLIIESVTRESFEDYIKTAILEPCQMKNSDFRYFSIKDSLKTYPHSRFFFRNGISVRKVYPYTREHSPSSTLNSSIDDLCKWMVAFMNGEDSREEMLAPHPRFVRIGLGFQLANLFDKRAAGHYGGDRGFRSYLIMFPDDKIGLVVLVNADFHEDFRQEVLHPIARHMFQKK
ncbi:MAG: serine hydrolase domain-containing protein [Cyclobacteriaceae bacterium]